MAEVVTPASGIWDLVILAIVAFFTLASAALPLAALKQWQGSWRSAAMLPLGVLGAWVLFIILARLQNGDSHQLWAL
ncbi:MAG: hypothetical protein RL120_08820, partial [Gammaproteobacteria bacterium]